MLAENGWRARQRSVGPIHCGGTRIETWYFKSFVGLFLLRPRCPSPSNPQHIFSRPSPTLLIYEGLCFYRKEPHTPQWCRAWPKLTAAPFTAVASVLPARDVISFSGFERCRCQMPDAYHGDVHPRSLATHEERQERMASRRPSVLTPELGITRKQDHATCKHFTNLQASIRARPAIAIARIHAFTPRTLQQTRGDTSTISFRSILMKVLSHAPFCSIGQSCRKCLQGRSCAARREDVLESRKDADEYRANCAV
ncbi:hypothetical protein BDW22DRAFT_1210164 [Trametopsis cervina]|nr:hypothetical protein BDW22DRAFT_1210164 [Trametopsis cervina]